MSEPRLRGTVTEIQPRTPTEPRVPAPPAPRAYPGARGASRRIRRSSVVLAVGMISVAFPVLAGGLLPICSGGDRAARRVTCIVDGDTGWEHGVKWRALDVDSPEIDHAQCDRERRLGEKARDQLRALMAGGYTIEWAHRKGRYGRQLATIRLADGRAAGQVLIREGLSQPWPNKGNRWCQ